MYGGGAAGVAATGVRAELFEVPLLDLALHLTRRAHGLTAASGHLTPGGPPHLHPYNYTGWAGFYIYA